MRYRIYLRFFTVITFYALLLAIGLNVQVWSEEGSFDSVCVKILMITGSAFGVCCLLCLHAAYKDKTFND